MNHRALAEKIVDTLTQKGYTAYFAGGWVRDFVMGHPSDDLDVATDAPPEMIQKLFPKTHPVGISFGVVIVIIDGHPFEVSTFRKDLGYLDGRRPQAIELASAKEDAKRRDFTINGMFFDPKTNQVIDYVAGQEDIQKKVVRTIGEPMERFGEDRLRMIRAVRFAVRFGFSIDSKTEEAITHFSSTLIPAVAVERIWQEWKKMAAYPGMDRVVKLLHDFHLLQQMFPDFSMDLIPEKAADLKKFPRECPAVIYFTALFDHLSKEILLQEAEKYHLSGDEKEWIERYYEARRLSDDPIQWVRFLACEKAELLLNVINKNAKTWKESFAFHIENAKKKTPVVQAKHLMEAGIKPGPLMGKLLLEAEKFAILNDVRDPKAIISHLREQSAWPK